MNALLLLIAASSHSFVLTLATSIVVRVKEPIHTDLDKRLMRKEPSADNPQSMNFLESTRESHSSFAMNVTIVDAHEIGRNPESVLDMHDSRLEANLAEKVHVLSSWVIFHVPGNHTDDLQQPNLPRVVAGVRDALADSLEICRSALGVVGMHAVNIQLKNRWYDEYLEDSTVDVSKESMDTKKLYDSDTLVQQAAKLALNLRSKDNGKAQHMNVTQMKAIYEVRIFDEMRTSAKDVEHRINRFQMYSKFSDLRHMLSRELSPILSLPSDRAYQNVMLDDVGYASRHQLNRQPLSHGELADCVEEVALHNARQIHQFIVAVALLVVALITCAGSTVFTIKHATSVPSRMNPLIRPDL